VYCNRRVPVSSQLIEDDDVDVACERRRVLRGDADNDMLKIDNLTKVRQTQRSQCALFSFRTRIDKCIVGLISLRSIEYH
jgi:hypothetical protein